ncbi:hypothetical protein BaRGS_00022443 [Batillaria attramentaria]|uniref:Profilin n=1 Tax=Batillaria attramentaria TaxID=370345 RepID=A0ABD0KGW0_9CAEN
MSWTGWTDSCLAPIQSSSGEQLETCCAAWICDMNGSPWAESLKAGSQAEKDHPKFSPEEFQKMARILTGSASPDEVSQGIDMNGVHYMTIRQIPNDFVICKKGNSGMTIAKAKQCIVIGMYEPGTQPGNNTKHVLDIRDKLQEMGY